MAHSAAIWVCRALELSRAYACVKTPLNVAVGTNFIVCLVAPPANMDAVSCKDGNLQEGLLPL